MLEETNFIKNSYPKELTQDELFECEQNFFGFFKLLYQIDQRNKKSEEKENEPANNRSTN